MTLPSPWIPGDRQRTCVIDPVLALSEHGIPLIQQLGQRMELWVVRELWNIVDNPTLYLNQPELITPRGLAPERTLEQERNALETTLSSLKAWQTFRLENDLSGLQLFWLGDSPKESLLPSHQNLELFYRWEAISATLDRQLRSVLTSNYILPLAFRDTIALAISLGSASILSCQSSIDFSQQHPPEICRTMEIWGMTCSPLLPEDRMVAKEREYFQQLLISTGTAKYLWAGTHLMMLQLIVPSGFEQVKQSLYPDQEILSENKDLAKARQTARKMWKKTRGFWHLL